MTFTTYDVINKNFAASNGRHGGCSLSNADKLFARSVAKRQLLIVKDLTALDKAYPGIIDKDVIGGLYALYTLLEDNVNSVTSR